MPFSWCSRKAEGATWVTWIHHFIPSSGKIENVFKRKQYFCCEIRQREAQIKALIRTLLTSYTISSGNELMGKICRDFAGSTVQATGNWSLTGTPSQDSHYPLSLPDNLGWVNSGSSYYASHQRWQRSKVGGVAGVEIWPHYLWHGEPCTEVYIFCGKHYWTV